MELLVIGRIQELIPTKNISRRRNLSQFELTTSSFVLICVIDSNCDIVKYFLSESILEPNLYDKKLYKLTFDAFIL